MPAAIQVIFYSWTEPLILLFFSASVFFASRRLRLTGITLPLLFVMKQHMLIVLPAVYLLANPWPGRRILRPLIWGFLVAAAINVPFLLWDPHSLIRSLLIVSRGNFRMDALSYLAWIAHQGGPQLPTVIAFAAAAAANVFVLRYARRTPASFAAAVGFVSLAFFVFNRVAFCNYYYFIFGALAGSIAAMCPAPDTQGAHNEVLARSNSVR
jgi:hypothetical protein